jgi:hypothetical protein
MTFFAPEPIVVLALSPGISLSTIDAQRAIKGVIAPAALPAPHFRNLTSGSHASRFKGSKQKMLIEIIITIIFFDIFKPPFVVGSVLL